MRTCSAWILPRLVPRSLGPDRSYARKPWMLRSSARVHESVTPPRGRAQRPTRAATAHEKEGDVDTTVSKPRPWTQEMVVVHRALRREFRLLADNVGRTPAGDRDRPERLASHADLMIELLHHHHTGEDELLWPRLRQRCPAACGLVDRMVAQHNELVAIVERVTPQLAKWRADPRPETTVPLAASLAALSEGLCTHTCDEEPNVLPVIEEHVTPAEWAELGERGRAAVPGDRQMFVLGLLLEEATDDERERWLAQMPVEARRAFETVGRTQYEAEVATLR